MEISQKKARAEVRTSEMTKSVADEIDFNHGHRLGGRTARGPRHPIHSLEGPRKVDEADAACKRANKRVRRP